MCTPGSSMQHGSFGGNYMPPFDQMGSTAPVDTENLSLEHRTQVTGRELQELLSVSHQSIDEAQERLAAYYSVISLFNVCNCTRIRRCLSTHVIFFALTFVTNGIHGKFIANMPLLYLLLLTLLSSNSQWHNGFYLLGISSIISGFHVNVLAGFTR